MWCDQRFTLTSHAIGRIFLAARFDFFWNFHSGHTVCNLVLFLVHCPKPFCKSYQACDVPGRGGVEWVQASITNTNDSIWCRRFSNNLRSEAEPGQKTGKLAMIQLLWQAGLWNVRNKSSQSRKLKPRLRPGRIQIKFFNETFLFNDLYLTCFCQAKQVSLNVRASAHLGFSRTSFSDCAGAPLPLYATRRDGSHLLLSHFRLPKAKPLNLKVVRTSSQESCEARNNVARFFNQRLNLIHGNSGHEVQEGR